MRGVIFLLWILPFVGLAQEESDADILLLGIITDESQRPIEKAELRVSMDGTKPVRVEVRNDSGYYVLDLGYDVLYRVEYRVNGYVPKCVMIDTRNVPEADRDGGFGLDVDMVMIKARKKKNFQFLESECMGRASYSGSDENFVWDPVLTELMKSKVKVAQEKDAATR